MVDICSTIKHKGHVQLAVRAVASLVHALLSVALAIVDIDRPHTGLLALFQLVSSASLFIQFRTADDAMFVLRASASFARVGLLCHLAACGRVWAPACDAKPWTESDVRTPFRAIHLVAAVRMILNGHSLLAQWAEPSRRTSPARGHPQLRRRSYVRAAGVPIHLARAVLKISLLRDTRYARSALEIAVNLARGLVLIPIAAWSLRAQWATPPSRLSTSAAASMTDVTAEPPPRAGSHKRVLAVLLGQYDGDRSGLGAALPPKDDVEDFPPGEVETVVVGEIR